MRARLTAHFIIWLLFKPGKSGCADGDGRFHQLSTKDEGQAIRLANLLLED